MQRYHHIINKISVQLNGLSMAHAFQWQQEVSAYLQHRLPAMLEKTFDEACSSGQWIHIDQLQIQLDTINTVSVEKLEQLITGAITEKLKTAERTTAPEKHKAVSPLQAWLYFLSQGSLPWWFQYSSLPQLEGFVLKDLESASSTLTAQVSDALQKPAAVQRLVLQSSKEMFDAVVRLLGFSKDGFASEEKEFLESIADHNATSAEAASVLCKIVRCILLQKAVIDNTLPMERMNPLLAEIKYTKEMQVERVLDDIRKHTLFQPQKESAVPDETTFTVFNAGLVILHPFLLYFFNEMQLLNAETKSLDHPGKALQLLHYLATGETVCAESDGVLNKILCGLEPDSLVYTAYALSAGELAGCQHLLEAVIHNWPALKNTSPEGLQQTFLQRKGKLSRKEDHWLLQVEQKTVDVLLNRLQWPLSIIRLPWMKSWLQVEWT